MAVLLTLTPSPVSIEIGWEKVSTKFDVLVAVLTVKMSEKLGAVIRTSQAFAAVAMLVSSIALQHSPSGYSRMHSRVWRTLW